MSKDVAVQVRAGAPLNFGSLRSAVKKKTRPELQQAIDAFPRVVKLKEKAAREKKKIMKNF